MLNGVSGSNDEELDFEEEEKICEVKYNARISRCVIIQALSSYTMGSRDHGVLKLWFDSMASHSITDDINLFGANGPGDHVNVSVLDWKDESLEVTRAGMTVFGPMLYSEQASGTILSADVMYEYYDILWDNSKRMTNQCILKADPNIILDFNTRNELRIMEMPVGPQLYQRICKGAPSGGLNAK